jgi:hypothetical protein
VGIDLQVVDIRDAEQVLWLRALVWPEHRRRALVLQNAIDIARHHSPRLLMGDGVAVLPEVLRSVPEELAVCVFHTHTINQLSLQARDRLSALLVEYGSSRDLFRVSIEWLGTPHPQLELTAWHNGQAQQRLLAYCDPHGQWLEWLDDLQHSL